MVYPPLAPFRPSQRKSSLGLGAHPVTSNKYKHIDLSAHATPTGVRIASCSWAIRNAETNGLRDAGWARLLAEWQTPPSSPASSAALVAGALWCRSTGGSPG